jgi:glycosyltransferase involved in cell wall biosynthesis
MSKNTCVIYAPIETYSGYGARGRDVVKSLIKSKGDEWDIKIISVRWGNTPKSFLDDHPEEWGFLHNYIIKDQLTKQPDYMFWVTIPPEAQPWGKWNCLITAGIETTICAPQWIEGCNRMDLILTSSKHSQDVFKTSEFKVNDKGVERILKLTKPVEVLIEGANLDIYKPISVKDITSKDLYNKIKSIPESFAFLFVGHWMQGEIGEDRKNVGLLIKAFYELFKGKSNPPALILKTSSAGSSYMDRREILRKIETIRKSVPSSKLPTIYLLHGEFSDKEINELYNHPKVKAMVSLTKGEGFGRPLLEFSLTNKPVITTGWSGHVDFLNPEFTALMGGKLTPIHPSAQVRDMLIEGSNWFSVDHGHIGHFINDVYKNYKEWTVKAKRQGFHSRSNFSFEKMKSQLNEILDKNIPDIPKMVEIKLPNLSKIELPKLKKI